MIINHKDWDRLVRDFDNKRCIVMLGPNLSFVNIEDKPMLLDELFANYLFENYLVPTNIDYDKDEKNNLPYIAELLTQHQHTRIDRVDLGDFAMEFYNQYLDKIPAPYFKLAELPFSIFVNTTPTNYIVKALIQKVKRPIVWTYNFVEAQENRLTDDLLDELKSVNVKQPLVINLFGSLDNKSSKSLVISEQDQYKYIRNVVKGIPAIPDEILNYFDERKSYLFFGFNLERWEYRLLLDSLNLTKKNNNFHPKQNKYRISKVTKSFYENNFNFRFIDDPVNDFIENLKDQLEKANILKSPSGVKAKIVFAYNESDKVDFEGLYQVFKLYEDSDQIVLWQKDHIIAGENIEESLRKNYTDADAILLMVSSDFLADDIIAKREVPFAINVKKSKKALVIPVLVRPSPWRINKLLRSLDPLPSNEKPISSDHWRDKDEVYNHIVEQVIKRLSL